MFGRISKHFSSHRLRLACETAQVDTIQWLVSYWPGFSLVPTMAASAGLRRTCRYIMTDEPGLPRKIAAVL